MSDSGVSSSKSSSFLRKVRKPLIERKRRERINRCLSELKTILLDDIKINGGTQVSKLDKADILEMTVSHLRQIQQQQLAIAMVTSTSVVQQYRDGFSECANEALRFIDQTRVFPPDMTSRVHEHLSGKLPVARQLNYDIRRIPNENDSAHCDVSSIRNCRSTSPIRRIRKVISPVFAVEHEQPSILGGHFKRVENTTTECTNSQSPVLRIPSRVAVGANDSPPQSNVWRPF